MHLPHLLFCGTALGLLVSCRQNLPAHSCCCVRAREAHTPVLRGVGAAPRRFAAASPGLALRVVPPGPSPRWPSFPVTPRLPAELSQQSGDQGTGCPQGTPQSAFGRSRVAIRLLPIPVGGGRPVCCHRGPALVATRWARSVLGCPKWGAAHGSRHDGTWRPFRHLRTFIFKTNCVTKRKAKDTH